MADLLVVFHPHSGNRPRLATMEAMQRRLLAVGHRVEMLATVPGPPCVDLIAANLRTLGPQGIVIAAGGDGTVRDVVEALLSQPEPRRATLALFAMGTANNAARSLDPALPASREPAEERLARVLAAATMRQVDVGRANGRAFLGSVAVGMDADILAWRNAWRPRAPASIAGYPLYLASCAINALRTHGGPVHVELTPAPGEAAVIVDARIMNVLVANTALYAGEFRFAAGTRHEDGRLDVLWNRSTVNYFRHYMAAWPRHLRAARGAAVEDDSGIVTATRVVMEWTRPVSWQIDGEEMAPASRIEVDVVPAALRVMVPGDRA